MLKLLLRAFGGAAAKPVLPPISERPHGVAVTAVVTMPRPPGVAADVSPAAPEPAAAVLGPLALLPTAVPISVRAMPKGLPSRPLPGPRFTMAYETADGTISERTVQLYQPPKMEALSFYAFCEMRAAKRSFKIDRILWIEDEDGERCEAQSYFALLRAAAPPRSARKAAVATP